MADKGFAMTGFRMLGHYSDDSAVFVATFTGSHFTEPTSDVAPADKKQQT